MELTLNQLVSEIILFPESCFYFLDNFHFTCLVQKCLSFCVLSSFCGAAGALHACWVVWKLPPSGPWGPWASLYFHQPLQHCQADNHSVGIAMGDHHVWGEGNPARDGDSPETGLTFLGSGNGLQSCGRIINNMVVPFRQTSSPVAFCGWK